MTSTTDDTVPVSMHLKLVAKVALITSVVAALVLIFVTFIVGGEGGDSYFELIQAHRISQDKLDMAMLLAGLFLIGFVATITGVIALYASFRVAGPMYRFCRDLELSPISDAPLGIRKEDYLQEVSDELLNSIAVLREHYSELEEVVDQVSAAYAAQDQQGLSELLIELKELEGQVHV